MRTLAVTICLAAAALVAQADSLNCRLVGSWPFGPSYAVALDSARELAFMGSAAGGLLTGPLLPAHLLGGGASG